MSDLASSPRSESCICALCTTLARYKCPRCAAPTCSLPCSRKHKQDTGCTGERDKAKYVPMNAYDWGTMMRDYCYLEDVGRKVSEWGNTIVRGGYMENTNRRPSAQRYPSRKKTATGKSKRDMLRARLESLGIDVELLPTGMERRGLNQSTFNQRSKCSLLTVEFIFYPPSTLASFSSSPPPSYKTLTHRNTLSANLLTLLQSSSLSKSQKQKENIPDWLPSILHPHPEAPECFVPPHCYLCANVEYPKVANAAYYHQLDPTLSLGELLQGTSFVEFPTIHIFDPEASSFTGTVVDKSGSIVRVSRDDSADAPRAAKRRKINEEDGLKTVFSLIGGYESEGSAHSDQEAESEHPTGLATLEAYSGSDNEDNPTDAEVEEDHSLNSDEDVPIEQDQLDPARLLEVMKQARSAADEDILDWEDEWDVDVAGC